MHRYLLAICLLAVLAGVVSASVAAPPNIIAYAPITLTNSQSSSFAYNSQVMISVNSLAYNSYGSPNTIPECGASQYWNYAKPYYPLAQPAGRSQFRMYLRLNHIAHKEGALSQLQIKDNIISLRPPPSISIANALSPNSIDVIVGSPSDSALVTATCYSGDTCQIDNAAGTSLASGTTTATLAYDSLPLGYTTLYANDISAGLTSNNVYVRRISISNSITLKLTNNQDSAVEANTPLSINFNALAYKNMESNSLNNTLLYFSNGTVAYSWLEGNLLDEQTPANALSLSSNVIIWFKRPNTASYLPANTGTPTQNTINIGFASTANNLLDGNFIGEAPELSPSYAKYDNGANVFTSYLNFAGTSLPSYYQVKNTASYTIDNGLSGSFGLSTYLDIISANTFPYPLIEDLDVNSITITAGTPVFPFVAESTSNSITGFVNSVEVAPYNGYAATAYYSSEYYLNLFATANGAELISGYLDPKSIISMAWTSGIESEYENYSLIDTANGLQTAVGNYYLALGGGTGGGGSGSFTAYWFRARIYPPNGIMPTVALSPPSAPTITLANAITSNAIDVIAGSPSDNALMTATCSSTDTCEIESASDNVLATGTTTATLAYNALPMGYSTLHANDITDGTASGLVSVRRVAVHSSIPYTFVNSANTPFSANTSLSIDFNALANGSIESNSLNNTLVYFKNGTVAYSWIEGNQLNQFAPGNQLYGATNVIIWFKSPPSNAFLPADTNGITTATVYLGFSGTSNNLLDGNFIGEAPYLSSAYAQYDNGANVFELYFNGDTPVNSFTIGSNFIMTQVSGVTLGSEVVNALQVSGGCTYGYPCLSYVYNKGAPNEPTTLQAAVANNNKGRNLASIDIQNGNTVDSSNTDIEAVYSGYSTAGFSLAYVQSGSYTADLDSQGSVATSLDFYTVYYNGSSSSTFSGSISPTLYSGGYSGTINVNPLASDNTLYIGDGIGNSPDTPTNEIIEFARALVPTPPGESSSSYPALGIAAPSPSSQSVTPGQNAIIKDSGLSGGKAPYSYQWYASTSGVPSPTPANAAEANTLLGIGTASGEAQSQNALFATSGNTVTGMYYFSLYGTDSEQVTANTSAAVVTVQSIATTTVGGGGPPGPSYLSISDNINSAEASSAPVFTVGSTQYYQNQLPAEAQFSGPYAYVRFACNVTIGSSVYYYQYDAYGLGGGAACNHTYQTNVGSIEAIYASRQNATTSTTSSTTTETSTIPTTTIMASSTLTTTVPPTTTISSYISNISVSANSPAQLNVTPFMALKISSSNQSNQSIQILVENQTQQASAPANYSKIYVFTLSATPQANININTTIEYNCSLNPGVVPFAYVNGTWKQIYETTVLQDPCRISFPDTNGHLVGIFEKSLAQANSTTVAKLSASSPTRYLAYFGIAIAVILVLLILLAYRRRKREHKK